MTKPQSARAALTPPNVAPAFERVVYPIGNLKGAAKRAADANLARSFQQTQQAVRGAGHGPVPDLTPVKSSNIAGVAHDGDALWVRFTNGSLYKYPTAGRDLHDGLMAAGSPGSFFQDRVRHFHSGERIE